MSPFLKEYLKNSAMVFVGLAIGIPASLFAAFVDFSFWPLLIFLTATVLLLYALYDNYVKLKKKYAGK